MKIRISDHFTYRKLFAFVIPSVGMMVFTSIYGVVDGYFVSNYAGSVPFAAINLILPFVMIFSSLGFMVGTGGTALVSYNLGLGNKEKANSIFSFLVYTVIVLGILVTVAGELALRDVALLLGATEDMLSYCLDYGRIYMCAIGAFMLQTLFQSFLVVAEKPRIGFAVTVLAGLTNMILDWLLVGVFSMGVKGAALATSLSQCVGGLIPLVYFILPNSSTLRLGHFRPEFPSLLKACSNGVSEFVSNISMNVVAMVYNLQLLKYLGQDGVAVYGVIMYVCFIFIAVFIGYSIGTAPLVGFNYGADNREELHNIYRKSLTVIAVMSCSMLLLSELLAGSLAKLYMGYDERLMALTVHAFRLYSLEFLVMGFNAFGSAFFTALNNGRISAAISFLRTLVFQISAVMLLPGILGGDGIWFANTLAELLALAVTAWFLVKKKQVYHY